MKTKKKLVSVILAVVLCFSFSLNAFAFEAEKAPTPEKHVVTLNIAPGGSSTVSPMMWNKKSYTVGVGVTTYTEQFVIPDRYFAYEMTATGGSAYTVTLVHNVSYFIASMGGVADGSSYKNDWIDLYSTGDTYQFRIVNGGSSTIYVTLTYYSWK